MPNQVQIAITAVNDTKAGIASATKDVVAGSKAITDNVKQAEGSVAGTADKIGHTGEVAAKMAINLLQAFGLSGESAQKLEGILRQVDDGFDALGKAAALVQTANAGVSASNASVAGTAGAATTATTGLTAAMLANPTTALLVGIAAAATAVFAAFQLWPKATDNVKNLTNKLSEQKDLVDKLLESIKKRIGAESTGEDLADRAAQKEALRAIHYLKTVDAAKQLAQLKAKEADSLAVESSIQQRNLETYTKSLVNLRERQKLLDQGNLADEKRAENMRAIQDLENKINASLKDHVETEQQLSNLKAQAEAAQDKATALPKEIQKKTEEDFEKNAKAEEAYGDAVKQMSLDRIAVRERELSKKREMEEAFTDAILEMNKVKKENQERAIKKREDAIKREEMYGEAVEDMKSKVKPTYAGLDQLTRNIQLSALKPSAEKKEAEKTNSLLEEMKAYWARIEKATEDSKAPLDIISDSTKKTADKIEKVGTLA